MAAAGSIVLELLAKTGSFVTDMDRAAKAAKKNASAIADSFDEVRTAVAASGAAVAGGMALLVTNFANGAKEIEKFAQLSNASTDTFQRMAAGAQTVGFSQEKLADILKDVNDKVGDFLATGGGELKDFFENIAPKVGVTAEQFRKLSGPEALQLFVTSLQKANVSQAEMTFYMEGLANDATALIPLLADNGAKMREFGDAASRTGQIISAETIAASKGLVLELDRVQGMFSGVTNTIGAQLVPVITQASKEFFTLGQSGDAARIVGSAIATVFETVAALGINVKYVISQIGNELGGLAAQAAAVAQFDFAAAGEIGRMMREDAAKARAEVDAATERILNARNIVASPTAAAPLASQGGASFRPSSQDKKKKAPRIEQADLTADQKSIIDAWREGQRVFDSTRTAAEKFGAEQDRLNDLLANGAISQDTYNRAVFASSMAYDELVASGERFQETQESLGETSADFWANWLESASNAMTSFDELAGSVAENFSSQFGNAFERMVFESESLGEAAAGMADAMARSVVNALGQMAAQWLAYQAVQMIVGKSSAASAAGAQTFQAMASQQMAALNAFASTAAIPIVGPVAAPAAAAAALAATSPFVATIASLGAMATAARATGGPVSQNQPYLVGERGAELFVPNTSGAIVPNDKLGGGGNVTVNLIEDKRRAGQTESRDNNGQRELDVFVADIMGDGPRGKAIQRAFGLQRRGY